MCESCGCDNHLSVRTIDVHQRLLASNADAARHNRQHFARRHLFVVNLMGSPGAGKTALLEATISKSRAAQIAVIEGDQATDRDSARIRATGASACQVETGLGCHLDAVQIHAALDRLDLCKADLVFIENVGNLVCPALFDLGEHLRVVVTNPTEGVDKPIKYPPMFRAADIVVLNKCDLLPHLRFNLDQWREYVRATNARAPIVMTSALTGEGIGDWLSQLDHRRQSIGTSV